MSYRFIAPTVAALAAVSLALIPGGAGANPGSSEYQGGMIQPTDSSYTSLGDSCTGANQCPAPQPTAQDANIEFP